MIVWCHTEKSTEKHYKIDWQKMKSSGVSCVWTDWKNDRRTLIKINRIFCFVLQLYDVYGVSGVTSYLYFLFALGSVLKGCPWKGNFVNGWSKNPHFWENPLRTLSKLLHWFKHHSWGFKSWTTFNPSTVTRNDIVWHDFLII